MIDTLHTKIASLWGNLCAWGGAGYAWMYGGMEPITAIGATLAAALTLITIRDRIAYSGKVPCNVGGATPGQYIVAVQGPDDSIIGLPVTSPGFDQYLHAVGRVNRVLEDGRAEIAVIIH